MGDGENKMKKQPGNRTTGFIDTAPPALIIPSGKMAMITAIFRRLSIPALLLACAVLAAPAFCQETGDEEEPPDGFKYYEEAVKQHFMGNLPLAIGLYNNAIMQDSTVAAYHADLGEAYRIMGDFRRAIEELKLAISLEPLMADAYTTLGVIYDQENLSVKAIEYHRKALKINPDHFIAMNNLGQVYDNLGLAHAAMAMFEQAVEVKPDFAPAYDNLGTGYLKFGDVNRGIELIEKAIELSDPRDTRLGLYYNDLGMAYLVKHDYESAKANIEKAVEILPDNPEFRKSLEFVKGLIK